MSVALSTTGNDRIKPGGNRAPWEDAFDEIQAFYDEAKNWASEGFVIGSQDQADKIDELDKALLKLGQEADELRVAEKAPYDQLIDEIQTRYNPYIQPKKGKVDMARASLKALLTTWRVEQQRVKDEAARRIREEAEEAERIAQQAFAQTSVADIEQREEAERMAERAADLAKQASKATKAATTKTGLTTSYEPVLVHAPTAISHYWKAEPQQFVDLVQSIAAREVRAGKRDIPGFQIKEVKGAR